MPTRWQIFQKPAFLDDFDRLSRQEATQVTTKISMLSRDPTPDGKVKKHLTHIEGKPYRIRSGDYRILYTYDNQTITVYKIERRNEGTYKNNLARVPKGEDDETYTDLDIEFDTVETVHTPAYDASTSWYEQDTSRRLPEPITLDLLNKLNVASEYHTRLLNVQTQDQLLACPGIDDETLLSIDTFLFETPLKQAMQQPDLVLNDVEDLLRYKAGELIAFLLKLSPEQEKFATWSLKATGPMLVKGGPGTGKSTVALYRVRSLLQQLLASKTSEEPQVLFTTYTNALVRSSEQLLEQLLGDKAAYVRVDTADKIAYDILHEQGQAKQIVNTNTYELNKLLRQAITETPLEGNQLQQLAQKQTLERLGQEYLLQEITGVIIARQTESLEAYQAMSRTGRKLRLNTSQRALIWRIYERWRTLIEASGKETWQQRRARAEQLVESSTYFHRFDAVIIDEAQDLDPSLLRLLIKLCKAPNRLFVTADANQSIYGSSFSWSDVHKDLKFQGRTSILRTNYRSTYEIGEAAQSYLIYHGTQDILDDEGNEYHYVHEGPIPDVRSIANTVHEAQLLAAFFKQSIVHLRLTLGSCAVLCPSEGSGNGLVAALRQQDIQATYMAGKELDLKQPGVKVITLKSSKGLEFPIVALAGFVGSSYPNTQHNTSEEERAEVLAQERRNMFVGMTRAMRSLLVIIPTGNDSPLFQGFDDNYWNTHRKI